MSKYAAGVKEILIGNVQNAQFFAFGNQQNVWFVLGYINTYRLLFYLC